MDELRTLTPESRDEYLDGLPRTTLQKLAKEAGLKVCFIFSSLCPGTQKFVEVTLKKRKFHLHSAEV